MKIASEEFDLEAGDSIYFDSVVQHSCHRVGEKSCQGVIVTQP